MFYYDHAFSLEYQEKTWTANIYAYVICLRVTANLAHLTKRQWNQSGVNLSIDRHYTVHYLDLFFLDLVFYERQYFGNARLLYHFLDGVGRQVCIMAAANANIV